MSWAQEVKTHSLHFPHERGLHAVHHLHILFQLHIALPRLHWTLRGWVLLCIPEDQQGEEEKGKEEIEEEEVEEEEEKEEEELTRPSYLETSLTACRTPEIARPFFAAPTSQSSKWRQSNPLPSLYHLSAIIII